jgi:RNA polymerase sigma-B factor
LTESLRAGAEVDLEALLARFVRTRDRADRNAIVERSTGLADAVATRLSTPANRDDLRQVARIGLLHAVERFDPAVGAPFGAFAARTIEGECKRYLRDRTWTVRPPRRAQELHLDLRRVDDQLTQKLGRSPTMEELADATGTSVEAVLEALEARGAHHGVSLDGTSNSESTDVSLAEFLGSEDGGYDHTELRLEIRNLLEALPPTDRRVIEARFFDGRSQQQIADELGISQSYLSRVLRRVLVRLRDDLDDDTD